MTLIKMAREAGFEADHAISSGAWNVQTGSQTWELIQEAKAAHGIKENT